MKKIVMSAWVFLVLLALPATALAEVGTIKGEVTPISVAPEVEVCLVESGPSETCTSPHVDGTYEITGLALGPQRVEFLPSYRSAYLAQYYNGKASVGEATTIFLTPSQPTAVGIDANLDLGARIEGIVTAADTGTELPEVEVCALAAGTRANAGCTESNPVGEYVLTGLPGGVYKLGFWAKGRSAVYSTQFYSATASFSTATPVTVIPASVKAGIDAELAKGATIEGNVSALGGAQVANVPVCLFAAAAPRPERCVFTDGFGNYYFSGLAAGDYQIGFSLAAEETGELATGGVTEDSFLSQYWDGVGARAEATSISLLPSQTAPAINARLETPQTPASTVLFGPIASSVIAAPSVVAAPVAKKKRKKPDTCKRGYKKTKMKGRSRCAKVPSKRHRKHAKERKGSEK